MKSLSPSRQVAFHQLLVAARKTLLMDALSGVLGELDPTLLKKQISDYVPADAQKSWRLPAFATSTCFLSRRFWNTSQH